MTSSTDNSDWLDDVQDTAALPPCSCKRSFNESFSKQCARFERWEKSSKSKENAEVGRYAALIEEICKGSQHLPTDKDRQLQVDVERTCPTLTFFSEGCSGRISLYNILRAWVVYDAQEAAKAGAQKAVGYVQGMNFLVTVLLWHASKEEDAFWLFVAMMQTYGLRCMYEPPDMYGLKMRSSTMAQLLHQEMPDLSGHLAEYLRNSFGLLITEWLLTLFAGSVPLGPLAAFWDHFFEEGYRAVYRLILARLRCLSPTLLAETDFAALVYLVKTAHVDFDCSSGDPRAVPGAVHPHAICGDGAVGGEAAKKRGSKNMIKRWVSNARKHFEKESSKDIELVASGPASPGGDADGLDAGSWTCMACNGSETCRSWEVLVNVLLAAEDVSEESVRHFETMFSSSTIMALTMASKEDVELQQDIVDGDEVDRSNDGSGESMQLRANTAGSGCKDEEELPHTSTLPDEVGQSMSEATARELVAEECSAGQAQQAMAEENERLRQENGKLQEQLVSVCAELEIALAEIKRLQSSIPS